MRFSNQGRLREQVRFLRRQYLQDGALPFSDILTDDFVSQAMAAVEGVWKDRIARALSVKCGFKFVCD
jgi:hypothetical protein